MSIIMPIKVVLFHLMIIISLIFKYYFLNIPLGFIWIHFSLNQFIALNNGWKKFPIGRENCINLFTADIRHLFAPSSIYAMDIKPKTAPEHSFRLISIEVGLCYVMITVSLVFRYYFLNILSGDIWIKFFIEPIYCVKQQ